MALALVRGILYAVLNPPFRSPDETDHFRYVAHLATGGAAGYPGGETNQPVLYYAMMVPPYLLLAGQSPATQLLAMRLLSLVFFLGTLWVAWQTARLIDPDRLGLAIGATAIVALSPENTVIAASANNDNLANLMGAVLTLLVTRLTLRPARGAVLAILAADGVAILTKGSIFPMVVFSLAAVAIHLKRRSSRFSAAQVPALAGLPIFAAVFALQTRGGVESMAGLWAVLLSFPTTWQGTLSRVVEMGREPWLYQFRTFWATFLEDSAQPAAGWYLGLGAMLILGAIGHLPRIREIVAEGVRGLSRRDELYLLFLVALVLQWLSSCVYYVAFLSALQFDPAGRRPEWFLQGRYLLPALVPLSILVADGLRRVLPRHLDRWVPLGVIALMLIFDVNSLLALATSYTWPVQNGW